MEDQEIHEVFGGIATMVAQAMAYNLAHASIIGCLLGASQSGTRVSSQDVRAAAKRLQIPDNVAAILDSSPKSAHDIMESFARTLDDLEALSK